MLLECPDCGALVDATEIANYEWEGNEDEPPETFTLVKCPKCHRAMLASQMFDFQPTRVYPPGERALHYSVPKAIQDAFTEARVCFRAKAFTGGTIMCRKTLEGICSVHGVKSSGSLAVQLKKLKENGVIENKLFEWAEELRTMGNEAAHGVESIISRDDAKDTLEFTEALLEYVFTYRHKFEEFQKRRTKTKSKDKQPDNQEDDLPGPDQDK
jgi:endogenous inhibitor of DNA gyrase (YacG/DUF329 family)